MLMNKYIELSLEKFSAEVAAKKSMPGGGSVAAYAAALSSSLASMVGNFTIGKKKYIQYDEDIKRILEEAETLENEALKLVDDDVKAFLPLADAYKMPSDTDEEKELKNEVMQRCLKEAATVPLNLMKLCEKILELHEELLEKGSKMLISDVGVGVTMLKSAVMSAKLNVLINIEYIDDLNFVDEYLGEMNRIEKKVGSRCDYIYDEVISKLI